MTIRFLQTGGTIDKDYPRTTGGYAFEIGDAAAARVLGRVDPSFDYDVVTVARKDSLDLTDEDRHRLREACSASPFDRLVITHGTDTMIQSAAVLSEVAGKVIVLTGAMRPERFSDSDAAFNLGVAVGAAQTLPPGVYLAMHGRVLPWHGVERSARGQFVERGPEPTSPCPASGA